MKSGPTGIMGGISSYLDFKPLTYGYANARVHGMFSSFIASAQLSSMASARTVGSLAEQLERTPYKDDLVALSLKFSGEELIELALGRHFGAFCSRMLSITPPAARPVISALLSRWDAHNLKTVILARKQGQTFEQVQPYLMVAATFSTEQLRGLHEAKNAQDFYSRLRLTEFGQGLLASDSTPSGAALKRMFLSMGDDSTALEPLLATLDVYAYGQMADVCRSSGREARTLSPLLEEYSAAKNLSTVMRLTAAGVEPERMRAYLVPGSMFSANQWVSYARLGEPIKIMQKLSRRLPLDEAMAQYNDDPRVSTVEVALERRIAQRMLRAFRRAQMSVGVIAGAILFKEQEIANIRKIVRGRALGLPADEIERMLIRVK